MKIKKKIFFYVFVILVIFLIVVFFFLSARKKNKSAKNLTIPTPEVFPTIDASVLIDLKPINQKKGAILLIENIPANTETIEYVITYETEEGGLQGVNSTIEVKEPNFKKEIIFGTSSSGVYVYHNIKGNVKLELVFKGAYGERFFSKEYSLL